MKMKLACFFLALLLFSRPSLMAAPCAGCGCEVAYCEPCNPCAPCYCENCVAPAPLLGTDCGIQYVMMGAAVILIIGVAAIILHHGH